MFKDKTKKCEIPWKRAIKQGLFVTAARGSFLLQGGWGGDEGSAWDLPARFTSVLGGRNCTGGGLAEMLWMWQGKSWERSKPGEQCQGVGGQLRAGALLTPSAHWISPQGHRGW